MSSADLQPRSAPSGVFNYLELDDSAAAVARDQAEIIRGIHREAVKEIGTSLLRAKAALLHGAFGRWLHDVVGIAPTTATAYMRAAKLLDGKPASVADLPPTVLYALASPTTPAEVVQAVVADAEAGRALDPAAIRARLAQARAEYAELRAAQKRSPKLTAVEHRARREKAKARQEAEWAREQARAEAERALRLERLRPLARALAGLDPGMVSALLAVLADQRAAGELLYLLREAG